MRDLATICICHLSFRFDVNWIHARPPITQSISAEDADPGRSIRVTTKSSVATRATSAADNVANAFEVGTDGYADSRTCPGHEECGTISLLNASSNNQDEYLIVDPVAALSSLPPCQLQSWPDHAATSESNVATLQS
ncbi:unnamed protein product [Protopolystoma xenopodis]|uniref:Uncharacterized protein n=1 Tax=Protopolystoma xenopodis TaxID=117903 RepID=A0A3S5FCS1_9PLAT|nr:unnamed protein product [Protopolystoma xenopodis]